MPEPMTEGRLRQIRGEPDDLLLDEDLLRDSLRECVWEIDRLRAREARLRGALEACVGSLATIESRMIESRDGDPHEIAAEARYRINGILGVLRALDGGDV